VIFDPDFPARRIPAHLNNVTMEQALESCRWRSKRSGTGHGKHHLVIPDQPQKRRDYEEQVRQDDLSFEYLSASGYY